MHMMPGLPVSSIPQCKYNRHEGSSLESFHVIGCFGSTFIEAHQASKMSCKVRSLKSQMKTRLFLEENNNFEQWGDQRFRIRHGGSN